MIVQGKAEIPSPHRPNTIYIEYNNDEHTISSTTSINDPDEIGVPAQKTQIARFSTGQSLIIISYMDNLLSPRRLPRRTRKQTKEIEELAERLVREAKETNNPQKVEWANQLAKDLTEIPDSDFILVVIGKHLNIVRISLTCRLYVQCSCNYILAFPPPQTVRATFTAYGFLKH